MRRPRLAGCLSVLLLLGGACDLPAGCEGGAEDRGRGEPFGHEEAERGVEVPVLRVIDGDTIRVRIDGESEPVRYIGIDTPETNHPRIGQEPFGPEATEANRRLLRQGRVRLVFGAERRDKYDRLLAYVYLPDGTFVNAALIEDGWAEPLRVPPNVRHAELFERLAAEAEKAGRGMWK